MHHFTHSVVRVLVCRGPCCRRCQVKNKMEKDYMRDKGARRPWRGPTVLQSTRRPSQRRVTSCNQAQHDGSGPSCSTAPATSPAGSSTVWPCQCAAARGGCGSGVRGGGHARLQQGGRRHRDSSRSTRDCFYASVGVSPDIIKATQTARAAHTPTSGCTALRKSALSVR